MAYTASKGFKNDVFISYAHADDAPILGSNKGWVLNFVDDLEKQLGKKLGKKEGEIPFIWKDEELTSNVPLNRSLYEEIEKTATYLIIMSPAYLRSDWCQKERHQFLKILREKRSDTRVFIIELDEIDRTEYPKEINENLLPCKFWNKEKGSRAKTLGIPNRNTEEYYTRLLDITHDLSEELIRIKENAPEENKGYLFLAEATDDLDDKREEIKRYLKTLGYKVLPEESLFLNKNSKEIEEKNIELLTQSSLYIQLLSNLPGKKLQGNNDKVATFQFKTAKDLQSKKIKMVVWRSSNFDLNTVVDSDLKEILESEFVRAGSFEEFKLAIPNQIPDDAPSPISPSDSKLVYICTDSIDQSYSETTIWGVINDRNNDIEKKKIDKKKIDCFFPLANASSATDDARAVNDFNFLTSDAVLFVYCNSDPKTIMTQIDYCRKKNPSRLSPFEIVAVYDGPPDPKAKIPIKISSFKFTYLNCRNGLEEFTNNFLNLL